MSSMAALITTAQEMREYQAAQEAARQEELKRVAAASEAAALADLKALLGDLADEVEIALYASRTGSNGEVYGTDYYIRPVAWHGVVAFSARRWVSDDPWRFEYYTVSGASCQLEFGHAPGNVWTRPDVLAMLADLQVVYEKELAYHIQVMLNQLASDATTRDEAEAAAEELTRLAPERVAEWATALLVWHKRRADRAAAVEAYALALTRWRAQYEKTLAENRKTAAGAQRALNGTFARYEVTCAAVGNDDNPPYLTKVWATDPNAEEGSWWSIFDNGNVVNRRLLRPLWVSAVIEQTLIEAGEGPWRRAYYVHDAGMTVYYLPRGTNELHRQLDKTIDPLPAEPTPPAFFGDGLTAAEHERINEVTRGMARVEIPF